MADSESRGVNGTEVLFTFSTTGAAIRAEALLLEAGLPVLVMSLPSSIKAGCGICLRVPPAEAARAKAVLQDAGIATAGCWLRHTGPGKSRYTLCEN